MVAVGALAWWPLDLVVYADDPALRERFGRFRVAIAAADIALALALPRIAWCMRHAVGVAVAASLANVLGAGWALGYLWQGDPTALMYSFLLPQFSVLLVLPLRQRTAVASAFAIGAVAAWLAHPATSLAAPGLGSTLSFLAFATGVAVVVGHLLFVSLRRSFHLSRAEQRQRAAVEELATHLEQRVDEQTRALRELHQRAQTIRAEQREGIARDLHDGLGQELTSLRLLSGLGRQLHPADSTGELFAELEQQVDQLQQGLRRVLLALRPQRLDELGLVEALEELTRDRRRRSGLAITFAATDVPVPLPADVSVAAYRIAQEAINNALRHAEADRIDIVLRGDRGDLVLEVADDGVGVSPERVGLGFGTQGIRERAQALGGSARWTSNGGARLRVRLPAPRPTTPTVPTRST